MEINVRPIHNEAGTSEGDRFGELMTLIEASEARHRALTLPLPPCAQPEN